MEHINNRFKTLVFHGASMASRFALFIGIARYLEPNDAGLFGLFFSSVAFGILAVGLDLYTYTQRELIKDPSRIRFYVLNHLVAIGAIYLLVVPLYLSALFFDLALGEWLIFFLPILVVEHSLQEINRLLIGLQRQVLAAFITFLRNGLWVWALLVLFEIFPQHRNLSFILAFWLCSILVVLCVALVKVWPFFGKPTTVMVDPQWILTGMKAAAILFLSTVAAKAIVTADRYIIQAVSGNEMVAVYSLYAGIAMVLVNVLESTVFSFGFQGLIKANAAGDTLEFRREFWRLGFFTLLGCAIVGAGVAILAYPFLHITGRDVYLNNLPILYFLLGAAVLQSLSMVPHYALYAKHMDSVISRIGIISFIVFACVAILGTQFVNYWGVLIGVIASSLVLLLGKAYYARVTLL